MEGDHVLTRQTISHSKVYLLAPYSTRDIPVLAQAPTTWNNENLVCVRNLPEMDWFHSPNRGYLPMLVWYQEDVYPLRV